MQSFSCSFLKKKGKKLQVIHMVGLSGSFLREFLCHLGVISMGKCNECICYTFQSIVNCKGCWLKILADMDQCYN